MTEVSGATAVNVAVAFNAIGWDASNIAFNAADALLGTDLLTREQPVEAEAYILNSEIVAHGDLSVTADSKEERFELATVIAQDLDDAGNEDLDHEDDAAQDAAVLDALRTEFAGHGILLSEDLHVTVLAVGSRWLVDDASGSIYTIAKEGTVLKVFRANLLDATVGNEVESNAKNDRVLVDAFVTATKPENKAKGFTKLKYGANGLAAGGVLASNRVSSQARAYIDERGFDHESTDTDGELRQGARVRLLNGDVYDVYEYVGADQMAATDFDYSTRTQPDQLVPGDRIKLHTDTATGAAGEIYEFVNPTSRSVDFASFTVDYTSAQTPSDLVRGDLVRLTSAVGGGQTGEVYEYQGVFEDFSTATQPSVNELRNGDIVKLAANSTLAVAGLYRYIGSDRLDPDGTAAAIDLLAEGYDGDPDNWTAITVNLAAQDYTSIDWRRVGIDLLGEDFDSGDWTRINAPLSIDLAPETQNYTTSDDWVLVTATPAGTLHAGGNITIGAEDSAGVHADTSVEISSTVTNNIDAFVQLAENLSDRDYQYTTKSGTQDLVMGDRIRVANDFSDLNLRGVVFDYTGLGASNFDLATLDASSFPAAGTNPDPSDLSDPLDAGNWTRITGNVSIADVFPNLGNLAESNSRAIGGLIVVNDVRSEVESFIDNVDVHAAGNVSRTATENATILSRAESNVSSSGGSARGTGDSIAINGQIVTNRVLSSANAYVVDSSLGSDATPIGGTVHLDGRNTSRIDATLSSRTTTGDTALALAAAFNTIGWQAENVLFAAADALLSGDPLVTGFFTGQQPAEAQAYILNSDVDVADDLSLTAASAARLNATVSNVSESEASALVNAGGKAFADIIASNKVSSFAKAFVDNSGVTGTEEVIVGGDVLISAQDTAGIFANSKLMSASSTSNDGGAAVLQETLNDLFLADFTSDDGSVFLEYGDRVRLSDSYDEAKGNPGSVYQYLGFLDHSSPSQTDLVNEDYLNLDLWKEVLETHLVPQGYYVTGSDSIAAGSMVVYNDVRGEVEAYINKATVTVTDGDISLQVIENATIKAVADSAVLPPAEVRLGKAPRWPSIASSPPMWC